MKQPIVASEETIPYTLQDLVAFIQVADHASFSRAAAILGESKGTVSRRITRLEAAVGTRLFQRTSRSVAATEAGTHFRDSAHAALETLRQAGQRLHRTQDEPEGTLRVTAPDDMATHVLPGLLKSFLAAYPRVRVDLVASDSVLDLSAHRLDVALRAAMTLADSNYVAAKVVAIEAGLFAAPSYLAEVGTPRKSLAAMAGHHRLLLRAGDAREDRLWLREAGDKGARERLLGPAAFHASSYSGVMAAAEEGMGVALLPTLITQRAVAGGRLRRVLPRLGAWGAHLFVVHARGLLPARVRAFRDHVRATLGAVPPSPR
jgi:DNA-binding transcriptional LysR family regulator